MRESPEDAEGREKGDAFPLLAISLAKNETTEGCAARRRRRRWPAKGTESICLSRAARRNLLARAAGDSVTSRSWSRRCSGDVAEMEERGSASARVFQEIWGFLCELENERNGWS